MNLKLEPSSILMFSGSNGAGKTSLARMLAGLLEPTRGRILIDGVDMAQIAPEWWRKQIMYLPQEPRFLDGTIADNIALANPSMGLDKIQKAITMAGLKNFIDQTIDGTETQISGGGKNLSLGIRRRIALARALATEGKVMIIDEPTEGLDGEGAEAVLNAINAMAQRGCTVMVFSHDPQLLQSVPHYIDLNSKPVPSLVRKQADASTISELIPAALSTEKPDIK
jgi:ATP-binding cassette subfamily C protein LapB